MKLSATRRGRAWLLNFDGPDRPAARLLADAVTIVGQDRARAALRGRLRETVAALAGEGPVWLLPVMGKNDILKAIRSIRPGYGGTEPAAFDDFGPGTLIEATPGSEGWIGNLLRNSLGDHPRGSVLPPASSLRELRDARVRTVLLVTDLVGSGKQLLDFRAFLHRNATIKSWRSYGLLRFAAATYCASPASLTAVSSPLFHRYDRCALEPTIESFPWTAAERAAVLDLCRRYGGRSGTPLGFGDHGGLFAFQESIPNTLPLVLRRRDAGWNRLLDGKELDPGLDTELPRDRSAHPGPDRVLRAVRQPRASVAVVRQQRRENRLLLEALGAASAGRGSDTEVAGLLGIDLGTAARIAAYLAEVGWVDGERRLTERGRHELARGKHAVRRVPDGHSGLPKPAYYPGSLR